MGRLHRANRVRKKHFSNNNKTMLLKVYYVLRRIVVRARTNVAVCLCQNTSTSPERAFISCSVVSRCWHTTAEVHRHCRDRGSASSSTSRKVGASL